MLQEIGLEDEYRADEIQARQIVDHPGARVIAAEADPELMPRLRSNVAGLPVSVVHAAVCGETGERDFYRSDLDSGASSLDRVLPTQVATRVPAISFYDLLDREEIDRVDLLKLDIEGADWEILDQVCRPQIAAIIGEGHGRPGRTPEALLKRLAKSMQVETTSSEPGRATFLAVRD